MDYSDNKQEKQKKEFDEAAPETKPLPTSIKWEAPEYEFVPKSNNWIWSAAIITSGMALASVLLGNGLFATFLLIAGFTIILYGVRRPKKVVFMLSPRGLQMDNKLFPYENLQSFWIHYDPPHTKILVIEPKKFFMPAVSIPLEDTDPNIVRNYLLKFLKEERREESLIATISRLLKF